MRRSKAPLKRAKKRRLGSSGRLVKTPPEPNSKGEDRMADNKAHPTATEMDYPAHERNYSGFLKLFKYGMIATAIVAAVVIYTIAN